MHYIVIVFIKGDGLFRSPKAVKYDNIFSVRKYILLPLKDGSKMFDLESFMGMINELERVIDYCFEDKMKLVLALTHSSYANECRDERITSNERLEFWEIPF